MKYLTIIIFSVVIISCTKDDDIVPVDPPTNSNNITSYSCLQGNQLDSTYWIVYDTNNVFSSYIHFNSGEMLTSLNDTTYTLVGDYIECLSDTFKIVDSECGLGFYGDYTFQFSQDTLLFLTVNDICWIRQPFMADYNWVSKP